jgi:sugar phosphate isomerase/epimerase
MSTSPRERVRMMTSRRGLLAGAVGLIAAAVGARPGVGAGRRGIPVGKADAAAPSRGLTPIGVQLYTVRTALERDFDRTLAALRAIGFREVEFAGYHGKSPRAVRTALEQAGLVAPSAHVPVDAVRDDLPRALEAAHAMGHRYVVVAWLPERQRASLDGYRAAADLFNRAGQRAQAAGMRFAYHNHAFEFERMDGRMPYDVLLERCDPRYVAFEMDLYWITRGGQDPLAYFARWPGRFPLVHVKDSAGPPDHRMVDVGAGRIPWKAVFAGHEQAGMRHCFVEHDEPADPLASVRRSYEYLRGLELRWR